MNKSKRETKRFLPEKQMENDENSPLATRTDHWHFEADVFKTVLESTFTHSKGKDNRKTEGGGGDFVCVFVTCYAISLHRISIFVSNFPPARLLVEFVKRHSRVFWMRCLRIVLDCICERQIMATLGVVVIIGKKHNFIKHKRRNGRRAFIRLIEMRGKQLLT